jgi:hypothetical protein
MEGYVGQTETVGCGRPTPVAFKPEMNFQVSGRVIKRRNTGSLWKFELTGSWLGSQRGDEKSDICWDTASICERP